MGLLFRKYDYLKHGRLSDIIRLMSVLAVDPEFAFRKSTGLETTLNGNPKSSKSWLEIAKCHPEFFKFNVGGDSVILLIRFLNRKIVETKEMYPPLSLDQTQKLIDQAISLHDKSIARFQRNSFLVPVLTALLASGTTAFVSYLTLKNTNASIHSLEVKVDKILDDMSNMSQLSRNNAQDSTMSIKVK